METNQGEHQRLPGPNKIPCSGSALNSPVLWPFCPLPCPAPSHLSLCLSLLSQIVSQLSHLTALKQKEPWFSSFSGRATSMWWTHFLSGQGLPESFLLGCRALFSSVRWGCLSPWTLHGSTERLSRGESLPAPLFFNPI